ncbi:hypothetical protein VTP01DRAFT_7799 [Rhizomucor pusillus]|uniref:uncharacterized protein n=1 Tax=Rhizomucor pusillus TaxID=4840 RepID=UPI0037441EDF
MDNQLFYEDRHGNVVDEYGRPEPMGYLVDEETYALEISYKTEFRRDFSFGDIKGIEQGNDGQDELRAFQRDVWPFSCPEYKYVDFNIFKKKLKIHFVHVTPSVLMRASVPNNWSTKIETILPYLQMLMNVEAMVEESYGVLKELKDSHEATVTACRFPEESSEPDNPPKSLETLVDPIIIRLSERKHSKHLQSECAQNF